MARLVFFLTLGISSRLIPIAFRFFLVDADTATFDNPKFAGKFFCFERIRQSLNECGQINGRRLRWQAKHGDSRVTARQKDQRISETQVERDKAARFSSAELDQFGIDDALKTLLRYGRNIVPGSRKNFLATPAEVLVELQLQTAGSSGTST